jgi:hypothetical protein
MCDGVAHTVWHSDYEALMNPAIWSQSFSRALGILLPVAILDDSQADIADQLSAARAYSAALIAYFNL